jgi:hypothetical protein
MPSSKPNSTNIYRLLAANNSVDLINIRIVWYQTQESSYHSAVQWPLQHYVIPYVSSTGNVLTCRLHVQGIIFAAKCQRTHRRDACPIRLFNGFLFSLQRAIIVGLNREGETWTSKQWLCTRAIRKATSGELLTKRAKHFIICKNHVYI